MPRDPYELLDAMANAEKVTLDEFFDSAREWNNSVYESLSPGDSFRTPLWEFLKLTKSALLDMGVRKALALVENWLLQRYGDVDRGWVWAFPVSSAEDARAEFINAWKKARTVYGRTILDIVLKYADAHPLAVPEEFRHTVTYVRFLTFIFHLQQSVGKEPIFIPTRRFAELLGVSAQTISHYRDMASEDGLIHKTSEHHFSSIPGQSKATEYYVNVELMSKW